MKDSYLENKKLVVNYADYEAALTLLYNARELLIFAEVEERLTTAKMNLVVALNLLMGAKIGNN